MAEHGTRSCYVQQKCRCALCKEANRLYYHERQAAKKAAALKLQATPLDGVEKDWTPPDASPTTRTYKKGCPGVRGEPCATGSHLRKDSVGGICAGCRMKLDQWEDKLVSAAGARKHLLKLRAQGVGYKTAADAACLGATTLQDVLLNPDRRITRSTRRKIFAVDEGAKSDAALVPVGPSLLAIEELLGLGMTRTAIAAELGSKAKTPALQVGKRPTVKLATEHKLQRLLRLKKSPPTKPPKHLRKESELERHQRLEGREYCLYCGFSHKEPNRVRYLVNLAPITWEVARETFGCIYPDTQLGRERFEADYRKVPRDDPD